MLANPTLYFGTIEDPRRKTNNKKHKLANIIMLTLCAVLSGCEDWVAIDGKSLDGSWGRKGVVHMLSAHATEVKLVLSACTVGEKENKINDLDE